MRKTTCVTLREGGEPIVICRVRNGRLLDGGLIVLALDYRGFERSVQLNSKGLNAFSLDRLRKNRLSDVENAALELINGDYEAREFESFSGRNPLEIYSNGRYKGLIMFGRKYNPYSLKQVKGSYIGDLELRSSDGVRSYDFVDLKAYLDQRVTRDNYLRGLRRAG